MSLNVETPTGNGLSILASLSGRLNREFEAKRAFFNKYTTSEVMTKAFLYQSVLNRPFSRYDRSLDMHISRVRKKLVEAGMPPERLSTLHGKGYRFS